MASQTRLYLQNASAPYTPATIRGAWDQTSGSPVTGKLGTAPAGAATTKGQAETNATNNWDVLIGRWISDGISHDQTIGGSLSGSLGLLESNAAANDFLHLHIFVTQGDSDSVRGTLLTDNIGGTEFTTTSAKSISFGAISLSSVAATKGDRIVVEVGYQAQNTVTTSRTGTLNYGNTGVIDLQGTGDTNVTTRPGWLQFTADLFKDLGDRAKVGPPQLDKNHPLAKNLIIDIPMFEGGGKKVYETVGQRDITLNGDYTWVKNLTAPGGAGMGLRNIGSYTNSTNFVIPVEWLQKMKTKITIAFWVRLPWQHNSDQGIFDNQWGGVGGGVQGYIGGTTYTINMRTGNSAGTNNSLVGATPTANKWQFFVFTANWTGSTGTQRTYLDGVQQNSNTMTVAADVPNDDIYVLSALNNQSAFYGDVSTVRIWAGRELRPSEIKALYRNPWQIYKNASRRVIGKSPGLTSTKTITGISRITVATPKTILGKARITVSTLKTILGKSRIGLITSKTIQGLSRIALKTQALYDSWNSGSIDSSKWNDWSSSHASIVSNQLNITTSTGGLAYYGVGSDSGTKVYDLTSSYVLTQLISVGNTSLSTYECYPVYVTDYLVSNNQLNWLISGTTLYARKNVGGVTTDWTTTYNSAVHKYFRIRESSGTTYFDYSTDGVNWTNATSFANPFQLTNIKFGSQVGTWGSEASTTTAIFDNINLVTSTSSKTILGLARVTVSTAKTILGKSRITKVVGKTIQGISRITVTTAKTIAGKSRITVTTLKTILGKSRITVSVAKTIAGKARVTVSTAKTILGQSRVTKTVQKTIQGLARITVSTVKTILGKSRITVATAKTIQGVAKIVSAATTKTIQGIARIQITSTKTIQGISRVQKTVGKTILGKARVTVATTKTILGKSRVTKTVAKTILGMARIGLITSKTILGKSRIAVIVNKTITGISRIALITSKTITGRARVTISTAKTILGKSRILTVVGKTITGKSRVTVTTSKTITGKSAIKLTTTKDISGISKVVIIHAKTITGVARIRQGPWYIPNPITWRTKNDVLWYLSGSTNWNQKAINDWYNKSPITWKWK